MMDKQGADPGVGWVLVLGFMGLTSLPLVFQVPLYFRLGANPGVGVGGRGLGFIGLTSLPLVLQIPLYFRLGLDPGMGWG